jgi:sugar O-acyltransferase (sialic acid O-acetyltransferase NeuD family)
MKDVPVLVFGAGGHGRVVADIVRASGWKLEGFLDDDANKSSTTISGLPIFAADEWLRSGTLCRIILGIGDNRARETVAQRVRRAGMTVASAIHPSAVVSAHAHIGEGAVVMPAAVLNTQCRVGEGAIINTAAVVEHDVEIGRFAHMSSNCTAGGGARIGDRTLIGMAATVLPGKRVGCNCIVGAGAVVTRDIDDFQIAYGVPAKVHRANR